MPEEEYVDRVDDADQVVGRVLRSDVLRLRANFRVAHVFAFDAEGRLLLHRLSARKRLAGAWGSSVAGAVRAGETPLEAAHRELREELGVRDAALRLVGKVRLDDGGVTKFLSLFVTVLDGAPLVPDPCEIAAVEFVPLDEVRRMLRSHEREFTPTFVSAFRLLERGVVA